MMSKDPEEAAAASAPRPVVPPPAAAYDAEAGGTTSRGVGLGVSSITKRWKREDLIQKGSLAARAVALFFSLISFIVMASNKHGGWQNFDNYQEYKYLLAMGILSTLYTGVQSFRHWHELSTGRHFFLRRTSLLLDFFGDQIMAYLLISSASSAIPLTNRMREGQDNLFTDSSSASITMAFLAFLFLAISALVSGYKLSTQSYI